MVFRDVATDYGDIISVANFSDEITDASTNSARKHWFVVLRCPDQVIFAIKDSMAGFSV